MQPNPQIPQSVTVIVCTRDRPALLGQCLAALARQAYRRFDILVVDNSSAQSVKEVCSRLGVAWVAAPEPGLTRARNIGARAARGEIIAYVDDDACPESGWLQVLMADFSDPRVAAVSGRVRYMKAIGESRAISEEDAPDECVRPRGRFDLGTPGWFAKASFGGVGDGGNMAFRRELIATGPGFDERLGRGQLIDSGDEHVAFASLIEQGHVVTHNPDAVVRHPSPATPAARKARRLVDLRSSIAYLLFLWTEYPGRRPEILRFLARAVLRRAGVGVVQESARSASSWQKAMAMLGGLLLFLRATREFLAPRGEARKVRSTSTPEFARRAAASRY